ncbi:MAG: response regulator [Acidobacteriota bacterium]|nr:response regulator [Acidobacteriota bacterium]MDH3784129.1 response regulator [Acidobacteriota bacterium]
MKRNFLVVVSNVALRESLAGELRQSGFTVTRAVSGAEAERVIKAVTFDAVMIESHLPDMTAAELSDRIHAVRPECRVLTLTSYDMIRNTPEQLQFGSDDFIINSQQVFELFGSDNGREGSSLSTQHRGTDSLLQVIDVMVGLLELEDRFFGASAHRSMQLAKATAEELGSDDDSLKEVVLATLLHDVGKIGVESDVLSAEGEFNEEQAERMREHVTASCRLFEHIQFPWKVMPVIRGHHERYDGKGYPDGLKAREIPMGARIVSIVDTYVALTSERTHRQAKTSEDALAELIREAGRQFDPEVLEAFQKVLDKRLAIRPDKVEPTVLIVDEQPEFRKLLKMRLLNEGLKIEEAESFEHALKTILESPPDLVVADVDPRSSDAFTFLEEMRSDKALRRVPFAMLARTDDRIVRMRALREGVDEYVSKQADLEEIILRIENVLAREAIRRRDDKTLVRRGITGDLVNLGLPDIVQTLTMGMKTACVTLTYDGDHGTLWFDNGEVKHAETKKLKGEDAFYEMIRWDDGEFVIEHGVKPKNTTVTADAMFLLMEGMRLIDESGAEGAKAAS